MFDQMNAAIQKAGSEERNRLFGASLTTGESGASKPFIVQEGDTVSTVIAKLRAQKQIANIAKERMISEKLGIPYDSLSKIKALTFNQ